MNRRYTFIGAPITLKDIAASMVEGKYNKIKSDINSLERLTYTIIRTINQSGIDNPNELSEKIEEISDIIIEMRKIIEDSEKKYTM